MEFMPGNKGHCCSQDETIPDQFFACFLLAMAGPKDLHKGWISSPAEPTASMVPNMLMRPCETQGPLQV